MSKIKKQKVLIAMSGGVDSSAAIALLKKEYEVSGVTFYFCGDREMLSDAKKVADRFEIEHFVIDCEGEFKEKVIRPFVNAWINGDTPNPCTTCNRFMKFPVLFKLADELGFDYVATGHYANSVKSEGGGWVLKSATLPNGNPNPKDQSYMLYSLTSENLSRIKFPLGNLSKEKVREIAVDSGLVNANKPDSQDICFIPDKDYVSFIEWFCGYSPKTGDFIDKNNVIMGRHKGHIHYTPGQRRGLNISSHKRLYVIEKNVAENTVTVGESDELYINRFSVGDMIWHIDNMPINALVKIRYGNKLYPCSIERRSDTEVIDVRLLRSPTTAIASGQCAVFYDCDDSDRVIGGGVILSRDKS